MTTRVKQVKFASEDQIGPNDLPWMKSQYCFLRVLDYSYSAISDILNVQRSLILKWKEDPECVTIIDKLRLNMVNASIDRGKMHAVQMMEILARIAATNELVKPDIAIKAAAEVLDRVGATKVNKSERHVVNEEIGRTFDDMLVERMSKLPPDMQQAIATAHGELEMLLTNAEQINAEENS